MKKSELASVWIFFTFFCFPHFFGEQHVVARLQQQADGLGGQRVALFVVAGRAHGAGDAAGEVDHLAVGHRAARRVRRGRCAGGHGPRPQRGLFQRDHRQDPGDGDQRQGLHAGGFEAARRARFRRPDPVDDRAGRERRHRRGLPLPGRPEAPGRDDRGTRFRRADR